MNHLPKKTNIILAAAFLAASVAAAVLLLREINRPSRDYKSAEAKMAEGDYDGAAALYASLDGYLDSGDKNLEARYRKGLAELSEGNTEVAEGIFTELSDYADSREKISECHIKRGLNYLETKDYERARYEFEDAESGEGLSEYLKQCSYGLGLKAMRRGDFDEAVRLFRECEGYEDSDEQITECRYRIASKLRDDPRCPIRAVAAFRELGDYRDAADQTAELEYRYVSEHLSPEDPVTRAYLLHLTDIGWPDSDELSEQLYHWSVRIIVNEDPDDNVTDLDMASKETVLWWHIFVTNGPPGESKEVKAVAVYPNGMKIDQWDGDDSFAITKGFEFTTSTYYVDPKNGSEGDMTFGIYDMDGNRIGEKTVVLM